MRIRRTRTRTRIRKRIRMKLKINEGRSKDANKNGKSTIVVMKIACKPLANTVSSNAPTHNYVGSSMNIRQYSIGRACGILSTHPSTLARTINRESSAFFNAAGRFVRSENLVNILSALRL